MGGNKILTKENGNIKTLIECHHSPFELLNNLIKTQFN